MIDALFAEAEVCEFKAGEEILHQHDEAHSLYVQLSGTVEFLIKVEGVDDLFVGMTAERGPLLGWSIVREPHRYTATVPEPAISFCRPLPRRSPTACRTRLAF